MKNDYGKFEIGILGLWHLGCIYATSLAKLGYHVIGYDLDRNVIKKLNAGHPLIFEPHLKEILKKYLDKNLSFTTHSKDAISNKKYIFITLDIPVNEKDQINLSSLHKIFDLLFRYISSGTRIIISSQVPIGTSRTLLTRFKSTDKRVEVIYFPENLRLGQGFKTFLNPDRIILGVENKKNITHFTDDFPYFKCPVLGMTLESAEMTKHALNSFLASNISFASEIGDLCELTGANIVDVVTALKTDRRISPSAPINPGLGFAGGTLGRDLQTLIKISQKYSYTPKLIKTVYKVNSDRLSHLSYQIKKILINLPGKNIGLLGLTYKPFTNTLRRSQSLVLAKFLHRMGAHIKAYDPLVDKLNQSYNFIKTTDNTEKFFKDLDLAILMTEWPQFKEINPEKIFSLMKAKVVFDTKNFLQANRYISAGFKFYSIGKTL